MDALGEFQNEYEKLYGIFICSSTYGYVTYGKNMEKKPKQKLQGYSRF